MTPGLQGLQGPPPSQAERGLVGCDAPKWGLWTGEGVVPSTEGGARALWRGKCRASLVTALPAQPIHLSKAPYTPDLIWTPQPLASAVAHSGLGLADPGADLCQ